MRPARPLTRDGLGSRPRAGHPPSAWHGLRQAAADGTARRLVVKRVRTCVHARWGAVCRSGRAGPRRVSAKACAPNAEGGWRREDHGRGGHRQRAAAEQV